MSDKITYLDVPYELRKEAAKDAGKLADGSNALGFDKDKKLWFAKPGADLTKLKAYLPTNEIKRSHEEEFKDALLDAGFMIDGLPIMDGTIQRSRVDGDKGNKASGAYAGYLDGNPAGWYLNYKEHTEKQTWSSKQKSTLSPEARQELQARAAEKRAEREAKQVANYKHNAKRVTTAYGLMLPVNPEQAYLKNKGVIASSGIKMDKKNRLIIPLKNENGGIQSIQRIHPNGFKMLKKGAQKSGAFFIVADRDVDLKQEKTILYAEGYSTSASIFEAMKMPVVMTVDAGNMKDIANKFKDLYPEANHVFLADNDVNNKVNKGKISAEESAKLTNGTFLVPSFNYQEVKDGLTDFNDLHQSQGLGAVKNQISQHLAGLNMESQSPEEPKNQEAPNEVEQKQLTEQGDLLNSIEFDVEAIKAKFINQNSEKDSALGDWNKRRQPLQNILNKEYGGEYKPEPVKTEIVDWSKEDQPDNEPTTKITQETTEQPEAMPKQAIQEPVEEQPLPNKKPPQPMVENIMPGSIEKKYISRDNSYYYVGKPDEVAFVDRGNKLNTKAKHSVALIESLLDIAETRNWSDIKINGTNEFKQEAWMQASLRGMSVKGYKPTQEDILKLEAANVRLNKKVNSIEKDDNKAKTQIADQNKEPIFQKVTDFGEAPYLFDKNNTKSYFVKLADEKGEEKVVWGADIKRAISETDTKKGDFIKIENKGRNPVTIKYMDKDEQGQSVQKEKEVHRNTFQITKQQIEKSESTSPNVNEQALSKIAEQFSEVIAKKEDRERFINLVNDRIKSHKMDLPAVLVRESQERQKPEEHER